MTREELIAKIESEGGVIAAVDYGICVEDLPEDTPTEICNAWRRLEETEVDENLIIEWLGIEE